MAHHGFPSPDAPWQRLTDPPPHAAQSRCAHVGHYLEIDRPRRLAFTWGILGESEEQSRVDIEITPRYDGCELVLVHRMDPQWASHADRVRAGWSTMLDAL